MEHIEYDAPWRRVRHPPAGALQLPDRVRAHPGVRRNHHDCGRGDQLRQLPRVASGRPRDREPHQTTRRLDDRGDAGQSRAGDRKPARGEHRRESERRDQHIEMSPGDELQPQQRVRRPQRGGAHPAGFVGASAQQEQADTGERQRAE